MSHVFFTVCSHCYPEFPVFPVSLCVWFQSQLWNNRPSVCHNRDSLLLYCLARPPCLSLPPPSLLFVPPLLPLYFLSFLSSSFSPLSSPPPSLPPSSRLSPRWRWRMKVTLFLSYFLPLPTRSLSLVVMQSFVWCTFTLIDRSVILSCSSVPLYLTSCFCSSRCCYWSKSR